MAEMRHALRAATSDAHARLDAAFAAYDLADIAQYRTVLQAHQRALPALEAAVAASGAAWSGWSPRAPHLAADLRALGDDASAQADPPPRLTRAAAWGVQYVVEGSRLGGRLLARRLAPQAPRSYLGGETLAGAWPRFQAALDEGLAAEGDAAFEEALGGARLAFGRFQDAIDTIGSPAPG